MKEEINRADLFWCKFIDVHDIGPGMVCNNTNNPDRQVIDGKVAFCGPRYRFQTLKNRNVNSVENLGFMKEKTKWMFWFSSTK